MLRHTQINNVKDFTNGGEKIQPIPASIFLILQALSTEEQRKYGWSSLLFLWEIYIIKVSLSLSP